jgi:hypothetical protein
MVCVSTELPVTGEHGKGYAPVKNGHDDDDKDDDEKLGEPNTDGRVQPVLNPIWFCLSAVMMVAALTAWVIGTDTSDTSVAKMVAIVDEDVFGSYEAFNIGFFGFSNSGNISHSTCYYTLQQEKLFVDSGIQSARYVIFVSQCVGAILVFLFFCATWPVVSRRCQAVVAVLSAFCAVAPLYCRHAIFQSPLCQGNFIELHYTSVEMDEYDGTSYYHYSCFATNATLCQDAQALCTEGGGYNRLMTGSLLWGLCSIVMLACIAVPRFETALKEPSNSIEYNRAYAYFALLSASNWVLLIPFWQDSGLIILSVLDPPRQCHAYLTSARALYFQWTTIHSLF